MKISKSKRQLAQLLIEAGVKQFPETANWVAQDKCDFSAEFYDRMPKRNAQDNFWYLKGARKGCGLTKLPTLIHNWHQTCLTRAEFDQIVMESAEVEPERSGNEIRWVNGSNIYAAPTSHDCMVMLKERGDSLKCDCEECNAFYNRKELSCNINSATASALDQVVAESTEQSQPDTDGWIEWKGGERPINIDEQVDVMHRDGITSSRAFAGMIDWLHHSHPSDIISYRLHNPERAEPQYCESVTRAIPEPVTTPTLDQLLQDYRNAADFAAAKQAEADEAAKMRDERWKAAQARACELGVTVGKS